MKTTNGPKYPDARSAICRATGDILKTSWVDIVEERKPNRQPEFVAKLKGLCDEFDALDFFFDRAAQAWFQRVADLLPELWD